MNPLMSKHFPLLILCNLIIVTSSTTSKRAPNAQNARFYNKSVLYVVSFILSDLNTSLPHIKVYHHPQEDDLMRYRQEIAL